MLLWTTSSQQPRWNKYRAGCVQTLGSWPASPTVVFKIAASQELRCNSHLNNYKLYLWSTFNSLQQPIRCMRSTHTPLMSGFAILSLSQNCHGRITTYEALTCWPVECSWTCEACALTTTAAARTTTTATTTLRVGSHPRIVKSNWVAGYICEHVN